MRNIKVKVKGRLIEQLKTINKSAGPQPRFLSLHACYLAGVVGFVFFLVNIASTTVIFNVLRIPFRYE